MNLLAKLSKLTTISLVFSNVTVQKTGDGGKVAILELETPLDTVRGSQEVEINGKMTPLVATDVKEVKVYEDDIIEAGDEFEFDDDLPTGVYEGETLMLDVSKGGQVWLRKTPFAASAREMRTKGRQDRLNKWLSPDAGKKEGKQTPSLNQQNSPVGG